MEKARLTIKYLLKGKAFKKLTCDKQTFEKLKIENKYLNSSHLKHKTHKFQ